MHIRWNAIAGTGAAVALFALSAQAAETIRWQTSFTAAQATAKKSHKLIFVDFYADWWGSCKALDQEVYPDKKVIQSVGQVVPLKLNVDRKEVGPLAEKYKVSVIPALLVLDADGKVQGKIDASTPSAFAAALNGIVKAHPVAHSGGGSGRKAARK